MRHFLSGVIVPAAIFSVCLSAIWSSSPSIAAESKRVAITDPAKVDTDFTYQGEYLGTVYQATGRRGQVGLQVIARGDGRFDATWYPGGLPGAGWNQTDRISFSGALHDGILTLMAEGQMILVDGRTASVQDTGGTVRGELTRLVRVSPTIGASPPAQAIVLFDGSQPEHLEGARVTDDGLLEVGTTTKMPVQDFRLHLEFRLPYMPFSTGQGGEQRRLHPAPLRSADPGFVRPGGPFQRVRIAVPATAAGIEHVPAAADLADLRYLVPRRAIRRRRQQDRQRPHHGLAQRRADPQQLGDRCQDGRRAAGSARADAHSIAEPQRSRTFPECLDRPGRTGRRQGVRGRGGAEPLRPARPPHVSGPAADHQSLASVPLRQAAGNQLPSALWPVSDRATRPTEGLQDSGRPSVGGFGGVGDPRRARTREITPRIGRTRSRYRRPGDRRR
jgi:hypothetical protein